jgi:transposase
MPKQLKLRRFHRGEKRWLHTKLRDRKLPAWAMHRYQIIALIRNGNAPFNAAQQIGCSAKAAYLWLRRFNTSGFDGFEQGSHPEGRPSQLTSTQLNLLYHVAQKRPTDVGLPFTNWSIHKLQLYLVRKRNFPKVSAEWLRRLLRRAKISWQRTKTWKQSHDPQFKAKKSAFWHSMPKDPSGVSSSVTISLDPWNYVRSQAGAGHGNSIRNAIVQPIRANAGSNSCMDSMMSTVIAWSDGCASAKPPKTLWFVLSASEPVIRCNCASMS